MGRTTVPSWVLREQNSRTTVPSWLAKSTPTTKSAPKPVPQRGPKGPTLTTFKGNPAKPIRRSAPAFKGEKPAGYTPTPQYGKFGQIGFNKSFNQQKPYYQVKPDTRSGIEQAVDRQVTPLLAKGNKVASRKLTVPLTVAGNVLAQASGGPMALDALNAARKGNVGAAAVDVAGLLPVGRLGRLVKGAEAGLRAAQEEPAIVRAARTVGKVKPAEAKALQVVHDGVPIEQRIAEAKAAGDKVELKALQAASKHVNDVNGMPRVNPANHRLVETYAKAERKLKAATLSQQVKEGLSGKAATRGMGQYEKVGAKLDDPLLGSTAATYRREQDLLMRQERGKRAGLGAEAMQQAHGVEAYHAALGQLKGELPKLEFKGFQHFDQNTLDAMMEHVSQHPDLQFYEKVSAMRALERASQGKVPTHGDMSALSKAFGQDTASQIAGAVPHWKGLLSEAINVPRALMSTLDLSALLRQNLVATITHPMITARNVKPMLQAFKSEAGYKAVEDYIVNHPDYKKAIKGGLGLTDFEGLPTREEAYFGANLAEKLTGGVHSPVRMSGRAYVALLNKSRMDIFSSLLRSAEAAGRNTNDPKLLYDLAKAVNSATGRGHGPNALQGWLPALNTIFFSPRLLFSRLDYLNPVNYTRLDPIARKEYLKGALGLVSTLGTVLALAKLAGAKVNTDPRNADFAKIRFGNTRIDPLGGFQQPIRLLAQLSPSFMGGGKIISSTTGKTLTLGPEGPGKLSRFDIGLRSLQGKLAPVPGILVDLSKQSNFQGQPLSWKSEAYQHLSPLAIQDAIDLLHQSGPAAAVGGYGLSALGVGVQTYGPKKPKTVQNVKDPGSLGALMNQVGVSSADQAEIQKLLNP